MYINQTNRSDKAGEFIRSYFISSVFVFIISFFFIIAQPKTLHWFLLPAIACGILTGADLFRWLIGELDPFDPKGLVGLILFHFWFLAPLLHIYWGITGYGLTLPTDIRPWLGGACLINLVGIVCYKFTQRLAFYRSQSVTTRRQLVPGRLMVFLVIAAVIGVTAQAYYYKIFLAAVKMGDRLRAYEALKGSGWLLMLGDSLPTILALSVIATSPSPRRRRTLIVVGLILVLLAIAQFIWSGLRGSRSAFVGIMFYSTCLIHFWWRRLGAIYLLLALALMLPFMYFYGFYKGVGALAIKAFESEKERQRLERMTLRTFPGLILGDLARADVHAKIVEELITRKNDYRWRWGRTYLNALSRVIPRGVWEMMLGEPTFKDRWDKGFAFEELNNGRIKIPGYYPKSTRLYGLTGEAMLNFGFWGVAPVWSLYGLFVGWLRRKLYTLPQHDARWLIMPIAIGLTLGFVYLDTDNIVFLAFKSGFVFAILLILCSQKVPLLDSKS